MQRASKILFLPLENKIHVFKPPCNVRFIIYRLQDAYKFRREITEITSLINSHVRLWKINHLGRGFRVYEFYKWYIFQKNTCVYMISICTAFTPCTVNFYSVLAVVFIGMALFKIYRTSLNILTLVREKAKVQSNKI